MNVFDRIVLVAVVGGLLLLGCSGLYLAARLMTGLAREPDPQAIVLGVFAVCLALGLSSSAILGGLFIARWLIGGGGGEP